MIFLLVLGIYLAGAGGHITSAPLTAELDGGITQITANRIVKDITAGARVLRVNSGGGLEKAAIEIATAVHEHDVTVVVDGMCFSACATYVAMASNKLKIESGGLIAFHTNIVGSSDAYRGREDLPREFQSVYDSAVQLYEDIGLPRRFLNAQVEMTVPLCIGAEYKAPSQTVFYLWFPSGEMMDKIGKNYEGILIENRESIDMFVATHFKRNVRWTYGSYELGGHNMYSKVPTC